MNIETAESGQTQPGRDIFEIGVVVMTAQEEPSHVKAIAVSSGMSRTKWPGTKHYAAAARPQSAGPGRQKP